MKRSAQHDDDTVIAPDAAAAALLGLPPPPLALLAVAKLSIPRYRSMAALVAVLRFLASFT